MGMEPNCAENETRNSDRGARRLPFFSMAAISIRLVLDVKPLGFLAYRSRDCLSFVFYRQVDGSFIPRNYTDYNLAMVSPSSTQHP